MTTQLQQVGEEIWTYEGSTVSFHGFPFPTRMTVIRLKNGDLWIHSPEKTNKELMNELSNIGRGEISCITEQVASPVFAGMDKRIPESHDIRRPGACPKKKRHKIRCRAIRNDRG